MSAEPNRKAPYSKDIRWGIVWQKISMELAHHQIAHHLNVLKYFEQSGEIKAERDGNCNSVELFIVGLLMNNPSLYLRQICQKN